MRLPDPQYEGDVSLERAIRGRRTIRSFDGKSLRLGQVSQLLWSAQGITETGGFKRAAPSGGALYPMDIYALTGAVEGLEAGVYRYEPEDHSIFLVGADDVRREVAGACLGQTWMAQAPLNLVITAEYSRITGKYGQRGIRYAMIEAGHIGQNIFLQAQAMGLAAGIVGAFDDEKLIRVLGIAKRHEPLLVMPVGYKSKKDRVEEIQRGGKDMAITITSTAFAEGGMIPREYTCDGKDISPPLAWSGIPEGIKSLALICDDPDAPAGTWVHWVLFNLPATANELTQGIPGDKVLGNGARHGTNDFRKFGYGGPCPPGGTHRYYFKLYALDTELKQEPGITKAELLKAMEGHIMAEGRLMGRYKR